MTKKIVILSFLTLLAVSCGGGKDSGKPETRQFKTPEPPALMEREADRAAYMVDNYWSLFFNESYPTDSAHILGVSDAEIENAVSTYLSLLDYVPMASAQKSVASLFRKVEQTQAKDTSSLFYLRFTELVAKYLYDPNSPLRNEDYYLPFVKGMAASEYTSDALRTAYAYEAEMCSLNPFGAKVPDFRYQDINGRRHRLYDVRADLTLLFFSNPGCTACKSIMDDLRRATEFDRWIAEGRLAIASIYIDEELDKWREYQPNYPSNWITGFDCEFVIREDMLYNVRAIPSLYLLDADKRVILKDAPTEKAIETIYRKLQ